MRQTARWAAATVSVFGLFGSSASEAAEPHNVILFVADGLRSRVVSAETAPALAEVRSQGVDFQNSHSIYPTVTTPNASVIATGHLVGDTGDFGNTIYVGRALPPPYAGAAAGIEDDTILGLMNEQFGGNYLGHTSLLQAARAKGYATAALGKLGPTAIQDVTARDGTGSIIIDDDTGSVDEVVKLSPQVAAAIKAAGLPIEAPDRGLNSSGGAYNMPGVQVANVEQQDWFVAVATRVLLPRFKAEGRPFVLVFWSRDPDGTQHNQGDSLNTLTPGINGVTSMASIRNASNDLAALRASLKALDLDETTDVVVTADHGFSTLSRESETSISAKLHYRDVKPGLMPQGFLAIDMAKALGLSLFDIAGPAIEPRKGFYPKHASILGQNPGHPQVVITPNGGTDLIYLPGPDARVLAERIVSFLATEDYTGAIFVRDDLGAIAGSLPTSEVGLAGSARTPAPAIMVGFRSFSTGCADPELCGVENADTEQQQGQGTHGSFGRQDTHNFMAAVGPDFKSGYMDLAPVSNADLAVTIAQILGLDLGPPGHSGRVLGEALSAHASEPPDVRLVTLRSQPAANGFTTVLQRQETAEERYLDAAGDPRRTVGLKP